MSWNTFGRSLRFTTWGESHGSAIGVVIDGMPPGLPIDKKFIQQKLDRRKPGTSRFVTQRKEADEVEILSGFYQENPDAEVLTTGTPISLMIKNTDQRSKDYSKIAESFRPGHADYTYFQKYGIRDPRGGGRSSARETACRVAAGAVAASVIPDITIRCAVITVGGRSVDRSNWNWDEVNNNSFFSPDAEIVKLWEQDLDAARKEGNSLGAVLEVVAHGVPAGLGAPLYAKLDADIASAIMGINAVKAVEIGAGFEAADLTGSQNADEMRAAADGRSIEFMSNHAGGILGGISTGQPIVAKLAIKPTSSIRIEKNTVDKLGNNQKISTLGRHDPCVGIRAVPIVEAMMCFVLADHFLQNRAQCG